MPSGTHHDSTAKRARPRVAKRLRALVSGIGLALFAAVAWASCTYDVPDVVLGKQAPPCKPKTCKDINAECGKAPDGCGGILSCGTCTGNDWNVCGGGGANRCGANACQTTVCAWESCGYASNGCNDVIQCGGCGASKTCGAQEANKCGCVPFKCSDKGAQCGYMADGCGGVVNCGSCDAGVCVDNRCASGTCVKKTCSQQGAACGQVGDGCSSSIDCGGCTAPDSCGGAGKANQCGCAYKPCCVPDGRQMEQNVPCCSGNSQGPICGCKGMGEACTAPENCCTAKCDATTKKCVEQGKAG